MIRGKETLGSSASHPWRDAVVLVTRKPGINIGEQQKSWRFQRQIRARIPPVLSTS
jgi:hypothetical protein